MKQFYLIFFVMIMWNFLGYGSVSAFQLYSRRLSESSESSCDSIGNSSDAEKMELTQSQVFRRFSRSQGKVNVESQKIAEGASPVIAVPVLLTNTKTKHNLLGDDEKKYAPSPFQGTLHEASRRVYNTYGAFNDGKLTVTGLSALQKDLCINVCKMKSWYISFLQLIHDNSMREGSPLLYQLEKDEEDIKNEGFKLAGLCNDVQKYAQQELNLLHKVPFLKEESYFFMKKTIEEYSSLCKQFEDLYIDCLLSWRKESWRGSVVRWKIACEKQNFAAFINQLNHLHLWLLAISFMASK